MQARNRPSPLVSTLVLAVSSTTAMAQSQVVRPPVAQYWMDVATVRMADMDELPNLGALGGMAAGMMGMQGLGDNSFGATKGMMPGRWLDIAVATQRKPAGTQATQTIPAGLGLGASLPLLPPEPVAAKSNVPQSRDRETDDGMPEQPKGRILLYWGCSDTVRAGQPKVLDLTNAKPADYAQFMRGRATRERGATAAPGHAIWPNAQSKQQVPKGASLQGEHKVSGEGIPASLQFSIGQVQDFMPPMLLSSTGGGANATTLAWPAQPQARAYFLNAMGGNDGEMVLWSSSETPEPGWGLMDYLSTPNLDLWLADKTLLPTSQTQCAIPAGIFANSKGAMVQGMAYGQELNLAYPPRPADRRVAWAPEWSARVRVKSQAMLPLEDSAGRRRAAAEAPSSKTDKSEQAPEQKSLLPVLPGIPGVGEALKGLFGR
ncbi:hypothetical protein [Rhodoferax sp.]|uniref:hypothetical protein n=1 Tax=Rhodoferax sp. TaxID=50421 RepID=UPI002ACDB44B|nr:hypothetical protein [Rhodoferax sp.]MDZ7920778.1 hypothetical protein [Rhodoferax sp.]